MAIRDRFRRAVRKSVSSDTTAQTDSTVNSTSSAATTTNATTAAKAKVHPDLTKTPSRQWTWRTTKASDKKPSKPVHPSERPFSETNLRHQELLSTFTMTFGRRKSSSGGRRSFNISPGTSRQCSIDGSAGGPAGAPGGAAYKRPSAAVPPDQAVPPVAE